MLYGMGRFPIQSSNGLSLFSKKNPDDFDPMEFLEYTSKWYREA